MYCSFQCSFQYIHPIEDLSQRFGLSHDKYLGVQMQELPTEDLCKSSPPAEKEASQAIVLNSFEPLVVVEQVYQTCLKMMKVMWAVAILSKCSRSFRPCTVSFPSSSTGASSDDADRTKRGRGQKTMQVSFDISLHDQIL